MFNASVRRAGERKGRSSFPSRGGLERGGGTVEGLGGVPSSEAKIVPRVQLGLEWAVLCMWAAYWVSLNPFLSSRLEGDCRPSWARLPNTCLHF